MPPGTQYQCEANFTGIYPVDVCLGFIWCRDGAYVAGPSVCPAGKLFDSLCQCCKSPDEVACEVGFGGRDRYLMEKSDEAGSNSKNAFFGEGVEVRALASYIFRFLLFTLPETFRWKIVRRRRRAWRGSTLL